MKAIDQPGMLPDGTKSISGDSRSDPITSGSVTDGLAGRSGDPDPSGFEAGNGPGPIAALREAHLLKRPRTSGWARLPSFISSS